MYTFVRFAAELCELVTSLNRVSRHSYYHERPFKYIRLVQRNKVGRSTLMLELKFD